MKKGKKQLSLLTFIIMIMVLILSVGYAFFTESLNVNGVASTVDFYSGTSLPNTPIKVDPWNDRYFGRDVGIDNLEFSSESWENDTYVLVYDKKVGINCASRHTVNYTIRFSNPTELEYTNGKITSEITQNGMYYLKSANATLSTTTLKPGEALDIVFTVESGFCSALGEQQVRATISFDLQGKTRYFYYIIRFN